MTKSVYRDLSPDILFLFFGDYRYDTRLSNLLRSLSKRFNSLAVLHVSEDDDAVHEFHKAWVYPVAIPPRLSGTRRFLAFYRGVYSRLKAFRPKAVCAEDVYSLPLADAISKRMKAPLFYDSREIYSALGSLTKKPLKQKVWSLLESRSIRRAQVFCTGPLDAEVLRDRYHIPLPEVIYNYPHYSLPSKPISLIDHFHLPPHATVLIYQGMLSEGRGLSLILESLALLPKEFYLVLFGEGSLRGELEKKVSSLSLKERVIFAGLVPNSELPSYTSTASLGLSIIEPISESYRLALPNKLFEYTLVGVPSVVSDLPALRDAVTHYGIGIVAESLTPLSITTAIKRALKDYSHLHRACLAARESLNWQAQEERVFSFFQAPKTQSINYHQE